MDKKISFWVYIIVFVTISLGVIKIPGGGKTVSKLIEMLYPILPACITFGPTMLLTGIIMSLGGKESVHYKKGAWFMIAGTFMITYALNALTNLAWH